jgi:hypothetical protein
MTVSALLRCAPVQLWAAMAALRSTKDWPELVPDGDPSISDAGCRGCSVGEILCL